MDAIFTYMKEGRAWRDDVTSTLAVVVNNQKGMTDYQQKCDKERSDLGDKHTALDKRVTETEGFQSRQIKAALGAGGLMGFLVIGGSKLLEKFAGWFT